MRQWRSVIEEALRGHKWMTARSAGCGHAAVAAFSRRGKLVIATRSAHHVQLETALAVTQNAPLTLINYASGHHAFEAVDDNEMTREIIRRTIDFVRTATAPELRASLRRD